MENFKFINWNIKISNKKQKQIRAISMKEFKNTILKYLNSYISIEIRYPRPGRDLSTLEQLKEDAQKVMSNDTKFFELTMSYLVVDNYNNGSETRNTESFPGSENICRNFKRRCKGLLVDSLNLHDIILIDGTPCIEFTIGEPKVILYVFWNGKALDSYIPIRGNWINTDEGCVLGRSYGSERKYLKKQGLTNDNVGEYDIIKNLPNTEPSYEETRNELYQILDINEKIDFEYIRKNGLLLFEYIRGSQLYGLARPESDEDHGGIYIEPLDSILGIKKFPEEVCNDTNDDTWHSLGKFSELLLNSNPNILEALFIPEDKILYKHPLMDILLKHRDEFITKRCFGSFIGYATTQIERARGLKKKITCPIEGPLKSCLEFIMYEKDGGSKPVVEYLETNELKQEYCGLVGLDKMYGNYCMYYDWGAHLYNTLKITDYKSFEKWFEAEYNSKSRSGFFRVLVRNAFECGWDFFDNGLVDTDSLEVFWEDIKDPFGYKGLVNQKDTSNQIRLSSVPKGEKSILVVSYNKDGYSNYCKQWKEYHDFEKHHNEERFNLAKEKQFDRKNMTHSARLLNMGIEIAQGKGVLIDRTNIDREFLMNIRVGNTTYDEIMKYLEGKKEEMKDAMNSSTIPDYIDNDLLNDLIKEMRKTFYEI